VACRPGSKSTASVGAAPSLIADRTRVPWVIGVVANGTGSRAIQAAASPWCTWFAIVAAISTFPSG
jgi:hypothetical protein